MQPLCYIENECAIMLAMLNCTILTNDWFTSDDLTQSIMSDIQMRDLLDGVDAL